MKNKIVLIPIATESVKAGFPSPASDFVEKSLDLNEFLINNPVSTFFVRVSGDSMEEYKIFDGDILIIDRSIKPTNNKIVLAMLDGEFTVKKIVIKNSEITLLPGNAKYSPIKPNLENFEVWGVVTATIRKFK
ncbi:MAG: SOS-response transcriptional regulator UmuD-like protein [Candidatus Dojkabacteria bacterium]|nr:MAG: SOS-response transcriptional regulator UmuD-like protein [Candidatus Dojkabacteria bacterium]